MRYVILYFLSFSCFAAVTEQFPSGLVRSFESDKQDRSALNFVSSLNEFKKNNFPFMTEKHVWREVSYFTDNTHTHKTEALYFQGRRVSGHFLKAHYNNKGFLEYVSSSLTNKIEGFTVPISRESQIYWREKIRENFENSFNRKLNGGVTAEPVIYLDEDTGAQHSALEIHLVNDAPLYIRHFIIDELSGKILSEKQSSRNIDAAAKVYMVSPFNGASATSVTLSVTEAGKLLNSNLHVRREENIDSPVLKDIAPQDYSTTISTDPANYTPACTGSDCPNQQFDGVNVFYHLARFRTRIGSYLTELGINITFPYEPVPVIVNALTLQKEDIGSLSNNAQFVKECRSDGSMPRCMVFFRPAKIGAADSLKFCKSSSNVQFHDLAREALVVAHEYQHYVTDSITNIVFGCDSDSKNCDVGDALHEAFSDYFGATYVSDIAGSDVTLVAEYGLQNCTPLQRELKNLRVYTNTSAEEDPHIGGLSFATGYWKLRNEYGTALIDKLILKSLTFLSTSPSFVDSVESLVKADKALNEGVHVTRIRQLFYDDLKILAGTTGTFRDSSKGIIEMGTKGCASAHSATNKMSNLTCFLLLLAWIGSVRWLGNKGKVRS